MAGIILAIGFAALVLILAKANPFVAFENILKGAFSTEKKIADSFVIWIPLIITTCGLAITFTVGLWNIGIEGQITLGAIFTTWIIRLLQDSGIITNISYCCRYSCRHCWWNDLGVNRRITKILWRGQ